MAGYSAVWMAELKAGPMVGRWVDRLVDQKAEYWAVKTVGKTAASMAVWKAASTVEYWAEPRAA